MNDCKSFSKQRYIIFLSSEEEQIRKGFFANRGQEGGHDFMKFFSSQNSGLFTYRV